MNISFVKETAPRLNQQQNDNKFNLVFPHFNATTHSIYFWRMKVGQNCLGITLQSGKKQPLGQNTIKFPFAASEDTSQKGMEINMQP